MSETTSSDALFSEFPASAPAAWEDKVASETGQSPEEFLSWSSPEGVTLPAYLRRTALDEVLHVDPDADVPPLADPSSPPTNDWVLCQTLRHPDLNTANEHARTAVEGGAQALALRASPVLNDRGLPVRSVSDLASVLDGIDLRQTRLHLDSGLAALGLYGLLREHLSSHSRSLDALQGSIGYDPVATLATGTSPSVDRVFALADDLVEKTRDAPQLRAATVDARVYHDAGASAVQELSCTLGALTERLARSTARGRSLRSLVANLQVRVSVSTSYFVEIAKLRALRLLVPQVVRAFARESLTDLTLAPSDVSVHAETSRRRETIYDPHVNMLRATTEAMAAVLGGCDTLTVRPYDAALRPPEAFGLRIARNVQLILEHEAHFDQVADPAAGSYYIETLTDQLAQKAWTQFQELEAEGGIVEALRSGTLQQQIAETRAERREAVDEREHVLVGTTHYPSLDERRRDDLARPDGSPSSNGTDSPPLPSLSLTAIRSAVRNGATLPEITAALRTGESPIVPLPRIRVAEAIESIRLRTEAHAEAHDGPPQVLLAPLGPPAARSARATFARNVLGVAGFEIEEPLKFETVDEAADAAAEQGSDVVVLCSSDAEYADLAPALASALDEHDHSPLLGIAGAPDDIDADQADFFVHQGSSLKETLTTLQEHLGIPTSEDA